MRSYPACTVTVYLTGTSTLAAIYKDNASTPLSNPFTSNSSGFAQFFVDNGTYDVQFSGAGIVTWTAGSQSVFDISVYQPHIVEAYEISGVSGILESQSGDGANVAGFQAAPTMTGSVIWQLPRVDSTGCWQSNGAATLSIGPCPAAGGSGSDQQVQYNRLGVTSGDANLLWNYSAQTLGVTGVINAGALQTISVGANRGNYIDFTPLTYGPTNCFDYYGNPVNVPVPVGSGGFGANDTIMWVSLSPGPGLYPSPCSPGPPVNELYGLNINSYFFARGGLATDQTSFNSIHSLRGGIIGISMTAGGLYPAGTFTHCCGTIATDMYLGGYTAIGHSVGPPSNGTIATVNNPFTTDDGLEQGTIYWDDALNCINAYNGTSWACLGGGGGGGSPGGAVTDVQYNGTGGVFAGSPNFTFNNTTKLLTVTTLTSGVAGIGVANGYVQADGGFLATTTCVSYQCVQAPTGGVEALSFAAVNYTQVGNHSGVPPLTTGDTFRAGAFYFDTGSAALQVFNGSAWVSVGGGSGSPGGATTNVQFNSAGSFGGSSNFTFNNTTKLLTITTLTSGVAGIGVANGYIQSDGGILATSSCISYQCIQAPSGGVEAKSFAALNYTQTGNHSGIPPLTTGDTFSAGALYYDIVNACEEVYNGSLWSCLGSGGGGGSPGGPTTAIQFNNGGTFGGSTNLEWNNGSQQLTITGTSNSTFALAVNTGYVQSAGGFLVTAATSYNSIQNGAGGGMAGRSFTAASYVQTGSSNGTPAVTTFDTFQAGAMYYDTGAACEEVYTGSTFTCLALITSSGVTSLNSLAGALNIIGSTNQVTVTPSGSSITLTLPQQIGTTSSPTFNQVIANSFNSNATGAAFAFHLNNSNFNVDGNGNLTMVGQLNLNSGAVLRIGGTTTIDASRNGTFNSLNVSGTVVGTGGFQTSGAYLYNSGLSTAISSSGNFVGNAVNVGPGNITGGAFSGTSATFSSAVSMNGGFTTGSATNSLLYIGAGGSFYNRTFSGTPSCAGVTDGWQGYDPGSNILWICGGGVAHAH